MFSNDTFKKLTKPKRERAQSAPSATTLLRDSFVRTRVPFIKNKRNIPPQHSTSTRSIPHPEEEDNVTVSTASLTRSLPFRKTDRVNALVNALQNESLYDVTLVGKQGAHVRASKYVLSCRCDFFADKFSTHAYHQEEAEEEEQVYIGEYDAHVIQAMADYCVTGELTDFTKTHAIHPQLTSVENIVQLARLAVDFNFWPLQMECHQLSRRFMNLHLHTACLFYAQDKACPTDILRYATCTLQECPKQALFGENTFVSILSSKRMETLLQSLARDLQELEKVKLLQLWLQQGEHDLQVARRLASTYIDMSRIRVTNETVTLLLESNLFDAQDIPPVDSSLSSHTDQDECKEEHVVVTGAGKKAVNGIYMLNEEEDMFVTSDGDYTLYCWNETWHIAATCDLSHSLYQCASNQEEKVPCSGWKSLGAERPVPTCVWKGAQDEKSGGEREEGS
eukprot:CAMPEP_0202481714 /NCGR_PEP_ID=MMETSP1361-20130828/1189_1 /ASSEMBLY_ACC=CAM_ASM_000849 /TAXON_ID=210615 /ORGANISM="Staurosira complex sp., Strain CCMP2646" /LENGTH=450 /DNA_ID=CAMNT_0049109273 /DNA_START=72 /DNA_END=1424 /DNA_ORIENTATION=-